MSNLGLYQKITTWSKKLGGPEKLLGLVAIGGYLGLRTCEAGVKKGFEYLKNRGKENKELIKEAAEVYTVTTIGRSNEGLELKPGEKFKVLGSDKDAILIEKIGDNNNPHFVSADLLRSVSDFK